MCFPILIHIVSICLGINTHCLYSFHLAKYSILSVFCNDHSILTIIIPFHSIIQKTLLLMFIPVFKTTDENSSDQNPITFNKGIRVLAENACRSFSFESFSFYSSGCIDKMYE